MGRGDRMLEEIGKQQWDVGRRPRSASHLHLAPSKAWFSLRSSGESVQREHRKAFRTKPWDTPRSPWEDSERTWEREKENSCWTSKWDEHRKANTESAKMEVTDDLEVSRPRETVRVNGKRKWEIKRGMQLSSFHNDKLFLKHHFNFNQLQLF